MKIHSNRRVAATTTSPELQSTPSLAMDEKGRIKSGDNSIPDDAVWTEIEYLAVDPKHRYEKPYELRFDTGGTIPETNMANECRKVSIRNFRPFENARNLEEYGFSASKIECTLPLAEFDNKERVGKIYYPAVKRMLWQKFPDATQIRILEHGVSIRWRSVDRYLDVDFDSSVRGIENSLPPSNRSLNTFSLQPLRIWVSVSRRFVLARCSPNARLLDILGCANCTRGIQDGPRSISAAGNCQVSESPSPFLVGSPTQYCSVWKSLQGPGNDWPLALCDWRTLDRPSESLVVDVVYSKDFTENESVYYNPRHKWYYYKDLEDDEVIVFQQTDSSLPGGGGECVQHLERVS